MSKCDLSLVTDRLAAVIKQLTRIADALEQEYPPTQRRVPE